MGQKKRKKHREMKARSEKIENGKRLRLAEIYEKIRIRKLGKSAGEKYQDVEKLNRGRKLNCGENARRKK